MLEITSHRNGELLSSRNGKESNEELRIIIRGIASVQSTVSINGIAAYCQSLYSSLKSTIFLPTLSPVE